MAMKNMLVSAIVAGVLALPAVLPPPVLAASARRDAIPDVLTDRVRAARAGETGRAQQPGSQPGPERVIVVACENGCSWPTYTREHRPRYTREHRPTYTREYRPTYTREHRPSVGPLVPAGE
jgi:hypothetical protein